MAFLPWRKAGPEPSPDKTVVVIGAGVAGLTAAYNLRLLDKEVVIKIVDPKEYGEVVWASYRSPFEEWVANGSLIQLGLYCKEYNLEHIQATVTKLSKDGTCEAKRLDNGENQTIKFDVCVVATGADSYWPGMGRGLPTKPEEATAKHRLEAMSAEGKRLLAAKSIVIIGGGLIGTELGGDIAAYAKKAGQTTPKVTIVHSTDHLCPVMSAPCAAKVKEMLEELDVEVILNEKAKDEGNGKVILQYSKEELEAEIVLQTIGFKAANSFMKDSLAEALDEKGWIKTDEFFAVPGSDSKIFAYGDCSPSLPNAGNVYMRVGSVLGHNIKVALGWQQDMKKYTVPFIMHINTIGPDQGVISGSSFWTRYVFPKLKNSTMFLMSIKDMIGVKKGFTLAE